MFHALSDEIVEQMPHLRSFARMIARDRSLADDLVQETVLRALVHADRFQPGTHLKAWLTTILRNVFFDTKRSQKRLAQLDGIFATAPRSTRGEQEGRCVLNDFVRLLPKVPATQRDALALVGANGFSYIDAAQIAGCSVGTMKSRTSRARLHLHRLLEGDERISNANAAEAGAPSRRRAA